jgi:hypothetical protein
LDEDNRISDPWCRPSACDPLDKQPTETDATRRFPVSGFSSPASGFRIPLPPPLFRSTLGTNQYSALILPSTMSTTYESQQVAEIEQWMDRSPDAISQIADGILSPVTRVVAMLVPEKAMLAAIDLGAAAGKAGSRLQTIRRFAGIKDYAEMRQKDLEFCDRIARGEQNWAMGVAAAEGAATGAMGLPGLAIDIPAIVAQAMRGIYVMGLCYGFELKTAEDRELAIGILSASGANSMKEKIAALIYLRTIQDVLAKNTLQKMAEKAAESAISQQAVILAAKALAKQLGVNLSKRKMAQSIPFLGAGIGATINAWYLSDVCMAARRTFQERWLREKGVLNAPLGHLPAPAGKIIEAEILHNS